MPLPEHITATDFLDGQRYDKARCVPIYTDSSSGWAWTPEELETIAQDLRERVAKRKGADHG